MIMRSKPYQKRCECGKTYIFNSSSDAKKFIRERRDLHLKRTYKCGLSGKWHVSRSNKPGKTHYTEARKFNPRVLAQELKEEMAATLSQKIVTFMYKHWDSGATYKVSSKMVLDEFMPQGYKKAHIASTLSGMRKTKVITSLGEAVPNQKGAVYFALTEILDKMTEPTEAPAPIKSNPSVSVVKPGSTDALIALGTSQSELKNVLLTRFDAMIKIQHNQAIAMEVIAGYEAPKNTEILSASEYLSKQLAEIINKQSNAENNREAIMARIEGVENYLKTLFNELSDNEHYKRGIRDGIKLAIDMGLTSPPVFD